MPPRALETEAFRGTYDTPIQSDGPDRHPRMFTRFTEGRVKKSTAIRLTLVSSLALGAVSCGEEQGPEQSFKGYCDENGDQCQSEPRAGYHPTFFPVFFGGYYYDSRGVARTRPGGPIARNAPASRVSRGGFGRTGSVRSGSRGSGRGGGFVGG